MIEFYNIVKLALQAKLGKKVRAMVKFMPRLLRQSAGVNQEGRGHLQKTINRALISQKKSEFSRLSNEKHLKMQQQKQHVCCLANRDLNTQNFEATGLLSTTQRDKILSGTLKHHNGR